MRELSVGKIRGLQQISTRSGVFTMCAADHRGSLEKMLEKEWGREINFQDMVDFKLDLCAALSGHASGILLDPIYGAAQGIAKRVLPGNTGLLVSVEATGYETESIGRITKLLDNWSVDKVKRMGASAVKMLVYYRSDLKDIAEKQLATINRVADDCIRSDIPFLVEPVAYPIKDEQAGSAGYAEKKPRLVVQTAGQITKLSIDVLKSEFPADMKYEKDKRRLLDYCHQLDGASDVPWVVLSAGVDYETFRQQVELACKGGASGFLGGRAIWQEMVHMKDRKERAKFLGTIVINRFRELADITGVFASPWYKKLGLKMDNLAGIPENWYAQY